MSALPIIFVAHGAPALATDPVKGADLARWSGSLGSPEAILAVSAHWEQTPAQTGTEETRPLIYDFSGFPPELYRLHYPAPGAPGLAAEVREAIGDHGFETGARPSRGWDHGVWVPLLHLYPEAATPVLQLSLPDRCRPEALFNLGRALGGLRRRGVLLMSSGVLVHNLATIDYQEKLPTPDWARAFDDWCARCLADGDYESLMDFERASPDFSRAHPTPEHFTPILVAAGAASVDSLPASFPVEGFEYASLSRRCVQFG